MPRLRYVKTADSLHVFFKDAKILDEAHIQTIGREFFEACITASATTKRKMVLDFRGVEIMGSAMIGKLVLLNKRTKAERIDLRLVNVGPQVLEVFRITRLNRVFRFDDDDDETKGSPVPRPTKPPTLDGHAEP